MLVVQGLPSDLDSVAEVVRTDLDVSGGAESVSEAMEEIPAGPRDTIKNKLKIVTVKESNLPLNCRGHPYKKHPYS